MLPIKVISIIDDGSDTYKIIVDNSKRGSITEYELIKKQFPTVSALHSFLTKEEEESVNGRKLYSVQFTQ